MIKLFEQIITDLKNSNFFSEFKFRKRDSSLLRKTSEGIQYVQLDHWYDHEMSSLVIYPIYGVRFDVLLKWFEKFSVKTLQDQRDRPSISFTGNMLSQQDKFYFPLTTDNYNQEFDNLETHLINCSEYVFSTYSSLSALYNREIEPILHGSSKLPDVGADWIFIDLALCKLVKPQNLQTLKQIIFDHAKQMYENQEPNIMDYYDRLEDIFHYLETNLK